MEATSISTEVYVASICQQARRPVPFCRKKPRGVGGARPWAADTCLHELLNSGRHISSRQVISGQQDAVQVEPGLREQAQ